jgi:large subunit ribosomal protein L16
MKTADLRKKTTEELAREAFKLAAAKLPIETTFITRHIGG